MSMGLSNPYTTYDFPDDIIDDVKNRVLLLKANSNYENIKNDIVYERRDLIKQKTVDLFSDIEFNGYSCQVEWFLNLSNRKLKILYKQLEDLWNYRLKNHEEIKKKLIPGGKLFTTPILDVNGFENREELQELIIHDIYKFMNIQNVSDKKVGYMYFLIGLGTVSDQCATIHDWIGYVS